MTAKNHKNQSSEKKAISAFIATILLVAFVIAIAVLVTGSLTTVIKGQTTATESSSKCPGAALDIISSKATATSLQVAIQNVGQYTLSNFTVIGKKNDNSLYTNTTAAATTTIAVGSSAIITLPDITSSTGCPFSTLRVSATSCPGVSIEIDNSSRNIC